MRSVHWGFKFYVILLTFYQNLMSRVILQFFLINSRSVGDIGNVFLSVYDELATKTCIFETIHELYVFVWTVFVCSHQSSLYVSESVSHNICAWSEASSKDFSWEVWFYSSKWRLKSVKWTHVYGSLIDVFLVPNLLSSYSFVPKRSLAWTI
jgi:hypothetical protein